MTEPKEQAALADLLAHLRRQNGISHNTADELSEMGIALPTTRELVSLAQLENPNSILVCRETTDPLVMPDNRLGSCSECGQSLQCRPYIPEATILMCASCALRRARGDA